MRDLQSWTERLRAGVDRMMAGFADRFGYPPDENVVMVGSGGGGALLASGVGPPARVPPALVELFDAVDEVSLPDVGNGYFLGPAERVLATYVAAEPRWLERDGRQVEVLVVGSDGGGALYVVPLADPAPVLRVEEVAIVGGVLRPLREQQVRELAADVPSFLRLLAEAVEACADGATPAF